MQHFARFGTELLESGREPGVALLADDREHLSARDGQVQANAPLVALAFAADQLLALEPRQVPGDARCRQALALGELLRGDPGVELDRDKQRSSTGRSSFASATGSLTI